MDKEGKKKECTGDLSFTIPPRVDDKPVIAFDVSACAKTPRKCPSGENT